MVANIVNDTLVDPWRDEQCGNPNSAAVKGRFVSVPVSGDRVGGRRMIIESAVLVVEDHEQGRLPQVRAFPDRVVYLRDQRFPGIKTYWRNPSAPPRAASSKNFAIG